jgi:hypothetical protein
MAQPPGMYLKLPLRDSASLSALQFVVCNGSGLGSGPGFGSLLTFDADGGSMRLQISQAGGRGYPSS